MTSLAAQLNKLRVAQKDDIALPTRTKASFLFDIKQAASIDDQTLYYICVGGLREIAVSLPALSEKLQSFKTDILSEKSLEFYRGTQTKEDLQHIEKQIELLIKLLAPFFLNASTHKVVEYLIRIYEIHAFHKATIVFAFLPYFETAFFLRMIQLLNIKQDEMLFFMESNAFQGQALDKKTLLKGLSRNNGTLFAKYSEFCFQLAGLYQSIDLNENCLHWKFFGSMLVEILRTNDDDQTLLFNILPFLSEGLKSPITDLRTAALMGISQISCRSSLTKEYAYAFFRQVVLSLSLASDQEEEAQRKLLVLILITQYQTLPLLTAKDLVPILGHQRISKMVSNLVSTHDFSSLLSLIGSSVLIDSTIDVSMLSKVFVENLDLKAVFSVAESVITQSLVHSQREDIALRCQSILGLLKASNTQSFTQAILFILKQVSSNESQKDFILKLLTDHKEKSSLIQKFGDQEYSLLSAISAQSKITKINALDAILKSDLAKKLSPNEKDLVKLTLSQILLRLSDEESLYEKTLKAYLSLVNTTIPSDVEFDLLEQLIDVLSLQKKYSFSIIKLAVTGATQMKVSEAKESKQLLLALCFDTISHIPESFKSLRTPGKGNKAVDVIAKLKQQPDQSAKLLLELINSHKQWASPDIVSELLKGLVDNDQAFKIHSQSIMKGLKTSKQVAVKVAAANTLIKALKPSHSQQEKFLFSTLAICLQAKQQRKDFDISALMKCLFTNVFEGSHKGFIEFNLKVALSSKNENKQALALVTLQQLTFNYSLPPQMMIIVGLSLLSSDSRLVREQTINLIEVFNSIKEDAQQVSVFQDTPKPKSAKKVPDRQDFTPVKIKSIQKLLKSITSLRSEIISDKHQLAVAINSSTVVSSIDQAVRFLLDLPSNRIRTVFIQSLKVLTKFNIVFAMAMQEQLNKEYFQLKQKKLDREDVQYIAAIGSLIEKMCLPQSNEAQEEFISSLLFPYLAFTFSKIPNIENSLPIDEQVAKVIKHGLLRSGVLKSLKQEHKTQALRHYLTSQVLIRSKPTKESITEAIISVSGRSDEETQGELNDKDVLPLLSDLRDKFSKQTTSTTVTQLEIMLELLSQIKLQNDISLLPVILDIIKAVSKLSLQDLSLFYLVELCSQLCISITRTAPAKSDFKLISQTIQDVLQSHLQVLSKVIADSLASQEQTVNDPFQQFMMEIDSEQQQPKVSEDQNEAILTLFHLIQSVANLQLHSEAVAYSHIEGSSLLLGRLALQVKDLLDAERSSKSKHLALQVFKFYHQMTIKTITFASTKSLETKDILSDYLDTLLKIESITETFEELYGFLKPMLVASGKEALASILLLCHGKESVSIKDNLELESTEIKLVQRICFDSVDVLKLLEQLLFIITSIPMSDAYQTFVHSRLSLLFDQETVQNRSQLADWATKKYLTTNKDVRRFKYLTVYLINEWVSSNQVVLKKLAFALSENQQQAKDLFYRIYLSTSVFNEAVAHSLLTKDYGEDKKVKKSLKRLHSRIQDLQNNLNNLLSYEVQVSIVNRVLNEFKDEKQTLNLKTITLQLLLNKTPQFATALSKVQERDMTKQFSPLLDNALSILDTMKGQIKQKQNVDKQNFIVALFSLAQRTASTLQSQQTKAKVLKSVLEFTAQGSQFTLLLHSQLILTAMTLFEVNHIDILEHLQTYFELLIQSFTRLENSSDFFMESFIKTVLKAALSLITFFSKYLDADQYERILKNVLVITDEKYTEDVKAILDVVSQECTKNVGFKMIFQAMLNCYDEVILSNVEGDAELSVIIIRYFKVLFQQVIQRIKKDFVVDNHKKIFEFFKNSFGLPLAFNKLHGGVDMPQVKEVEQAIGESYLQFVIKMNEEQLRPLIVKQVKQAFKIKGDGQPINKHKLIMFLRTMNILLNGLREFFVPILPLYFEKLLETLTVLGAPTGESLKRKRDQIDFEQDETQQHTLYELLQLVLETLRLNFSYDSGSFIQNDIFEKLSEPLSRLVTLIQLGDHYTHFIEDHLKPTVFEAVERISNDDMWKKINYDLLMHTRSSAIQVRQGAFKVVQHLFDKVGERYLILLNDTLPFLSEGMEDENHEVETTAKAIVARIEQMTGDSIHEYLK